MTQHELLTILEDVESISGIELSNSTDMNYPAAHIALRRFNRKYFVVVDKVVGRKVFYSVTERGLNTLEYYNTHGCSNDDCSCHK